MQIIIAVVDDIPRVVPRHFSVEGTPRRVMYSPSLNALIVGVSKVPKTSSGEALHTARGGAQPKSDRASLHFIDPNRYEMQHH
jgi:hypothetical protein